MSKGFIEDSNFRVANQLVIQATKAIFDSDEEFRTEPRLMNIVMCASWSVREYFFGDRNKGFDDVVADYCWAYCEADHFEKVDLESPVRNPGYVPEIEFRFTALPNADRRPTVGYWNTVRKVYATVVFKLLESEGQAPHEIALFFGKLNNQIAFSQATTSNEEFRELVEKCGGSISRIARCLRVTNHPTRRRLIRLLKSEGLEAINPQTGKLRRDWYSALFGYEPEKDVGSIRNQS